MMQLQMGEKYGYRNAQTTVIAPTGTIGLVMDCDTTGVEPDFALVKFKKLIRWWLFQNHQPICSCCIKKSWVTAEKEIDAIIKYAVGTCIICRCSIYQSSNVE